MGMSSHLALVPQEPAPDPGVDAAVVLRPERPCDHATAQALIERAFGPGRFAKTAERLREGNTARLDLSVCAFGGGGLVGVVRLWPVVVGETPAVFLGPIAVESQWRKHGVGARLVNAAVSAATGTGERLILLVGDPPFFSPLGFEVVPGGCLTLPGPVDPRRIMWRALVPGAGDDVRGLVHGPGWRPGLSAQAGRV